MKARKLTEAERLARHNAEMQFALANNCSVLEARTRMARIRWLEFEREAEERWECVRRCGTSSDRPVQSDGQGQPVPADRPGPQYWWQKL